MSRTGVFTVVLQAAASATELQALDLLYRITCGLDSTEPGKLQFSVWRNEVLTYVAETSLLLRFCQALMRGSWDEERYEEAVEWLSEEIGALEREAGSLTAVIKDLCERKIVRAEFPRSSDVRERCRY